MARIRWIPALAVSAAVGMLPLASHAADPTSSDTMARPGAVELRDGTGARLGVPGNELAVKPSSTSPGASASTPAYSKPGTATYATPNASAIATANQAVTVFTAGSVTTGCFIYNPIGNVVLYVDMVQTALAGQATSIPVLPNQYWTCPYPPSGAVSAVAAQTQPFNAIRY